MSALPSPGAEVPSLPELFERIYARLKELSALYMRQQPAGHTLQPTAIVHEAFMKLADRDPSEFEGEEHFLATAATVLRSVLIDHARRRGSRKRGAGRRGVSMEGIDPASAGEEVGGMLELEDALRALAEVDQRSAKVANLRIFGGLGMEHIARLVGTSVPTVERDWRFARAFLERQYALVTDDDAARGAGR